MKIVAILSFTLSVLILEPVLASQSKSIKGIGIFVKTEANSTDNIAGVGVFQRLEYNNSPFAMEVSTTLNYAEVLTEQGFVEDYLAWEGGMKLGYFSDLFIYIEAGIDLSELALDDRRNDCCEEYERRNNSIDGYAGVGAGVTLGHLRLELFSRLRQIDGANWTSESHVFYGAQLSVAF
jgi:hypothetical protein